MKKALVLLCGLLLVSGLFAETNKMTIGINFGTMTDKDFSFNPFLWTVGGELDIPFGRSLMFSPELMIVGYQFKFKEFVAFPAVILNATFSNFFAGGGLAKGFYIGSGTATELTEVALKLNAGFLSESLKITAYIITPFDAIFGDMVVGASLGFRL
ncbi:MAG TPA: hypothetical protein VLQ89_00980 [Candidatus Binatia bacterium]|nr:hypothetical protein [Candidatus Binatia bacterium]